MRTSPRPSSATASRTTSYAALVGDVDLQQPTVDPDGQPGGGRAVRAARRGRRRPRPRPRRSRAVTDAVVECRSSRPPSITTMPSQTRSSSPSRWEVTITEMPNSRPIRRISAEHVVAAGRVEAVGRLVEQHQARVVHQRLGELDPLPHAGGVAAHRPVALLVEPDVAQRVGGPLAGGGRRQPRHPAHVDARTRWPTRRAAGSRARACSRPAPGSPGRRCATSRPSTPRRTLASPAAARAGS